MHSIRRNHKASKMINSAKTTSDIMGFTDDDFYNQPTSMTCDDIWLKFDLPSPPLSPRRDDDDLDLENLTMPFDLDTEDLMMFDDEKVCEAMKVFNTFSETPPDPNLQSNLIQDIMWSAPMKVEDVGKAAAKNGQEKRNRCDSCSRPFHTSCVAPEEVFPYETPIGGNMSKTRVHSLGIETPSDSEEEIDVVTVEKHYKVTVPAKRKHKTDDEEETKTVTLTIEHKPVTCSQTVVTKRCPSVHRVDCPTDVHNYSLPVTSLKRVRSYPSSPVTHKSSKKLKRDISIPSDLRKVAQKLKSSIHNYSSSSSRNSSDSEEFCESGKRTQHNVLERKRRTDLKNSFFHLRDSVPELEGQERAPKVVILRKASQYIHRLVDDGKRYDREVEQLKIKKDRLRRHLARLRDY